MNTYKFYEVDIRMINFSVRNIYADDRSFQIRQWFVLIASQTFLEGPFVFLVAFRTHSCKGKSWFLLHEMNPLYKGWFSIDVTGCATWSST